MTIEIANYLFDGPYTLIQDLKGDAGVYAVLCIHGEGNSFLIDVGESDHVRSGVEGSEKKSCWIENCKGVLAVAILYTPDLNQAGRLDIVKMIRSRDFVPCSGEDA
jgi:hypothetical protein